MIPAIIIDIDGTLANIDHRRQFVTGGRKAWNLFDSECKKDTPNDWCVKIVNSITTSPYTRDISILFVSGRKERYREITEAQISTWTFARLDIGSLFFLFMRPDEDFSEDTKIKKEIYENHIKDKYNVLFCIDDSENIVQLWRSLGLICLDCAGYKRL